MCNKSNEIWMPIQEGNGLFSSRLDTNEQVRKLNKKEVGTKGGVVLEPKGKKVADDYREKRKQIECALTNQEGVSSNSLKGKVGRMAYKFATISPLIDYAESINSSNLIQYRSVLKCGRTITQSDNVFLKQDFYCGSRLCPICSAIRSQKVAELVLSVISLNEIWCFLTLTNSNNLIDFDIDNLKKRLSDENKWFVKVKDKWLKRGGNSSAIISLEIVPPGYKKQKKGGVYYADYHPHYHILTTKAFAEYLKEEWLKEYPTASHINQKIKLVSDRAKKKNKTITGALQDTIREVVKYSLKACLPKMEKGGFSCLNVEGVDNIVTLMKGKRRLKMWGDFYDIENSVIVVEDKEISELDLTKVVYNDLPVQDTGMMVESFDIRGNSMGLISAFVSTIVWIYDYKRHNYFYVDDWEKEHCLVPEYEKKEIKIMVCIGKKIIKHQIT